MTDNLVGVWAGTRNSSSAPPIMTAQTLAPNDINRTRWRRRQWEEVDMKRPSLLRSVLSTIMSAFSSVVPPTGHCHYSQQPEESSVSTDWWRRRVCWLFPRRWRPSPRQDWKQNAPCTPDRKYTPVTRVAVLVLTSVRQLTGEQVPWRREPCFCPRGPPGWSWTLKHEWHRWHVRQKQ